MAKLVLTNANITIGGTDVSSSCQSVQIETTVDEVETTSFGPGNGKTRVGGLLDSTISLSMHNDFSAIEGLLYPLIGSTTSVVVKPNGTAVSSTNPSFSAVVLVNSWSPVNGAVGELNAVDVSFPVSGTITKSIV
jgi:hypothetical protein